LGGSSGQDQASITAAIKAGPGLRQFSFKFLFVY
jgi:hypothetical protein